MKLPLAVFLCGCGVAMSQASGYEVLLRADAPEPVQFAAGELSRYCGRIFGRSFPVVRVQALGNDLAVVLAQDGRRDALPGGLDGQARALGPDGFVIKGLPGRIVFIGGSPRGLVFAVYTFLEQCLGCRWYYPDPKDQIVPAQDIKALDRIMAQGIQPLDSAQDKLAERPDFAYREREFRDVSPMTDETDARIVAQIDWWAKLRMNCFLINFGYAQDKALWERWKKRLIPEIKKRGLLLGIGEHGSYPLFLNPETYAREHPDWYCEIGGRRLGAMSLPDGRLAQFCTTNKEAAQTFLGNFVKFARENPEIDIYYPAPNDGGLWCECASCRGLSVADRYLALDNQIAEALAAIRPDYRVLHLAYANHRLPPEKTRPHPNVDVDVACWGRNFAYPLSDPRTMPGDKDYLSVFLQWRDLCRACAKDGVGPPRTNELVRGPRVVYHCKFMRHLWLGLHLMPLKVVDVDMPYLRDMGLAGFDFPMGFVGIWTKALNAYVIAHKCWRADADRAAMVDEYFRLYYGESAADARRACELAEEALPSLVYGNNFALIWSPALSAPRMNSPAGLLEYAADAEAKLSEAAALAAAAQPRASNPTVRERLRKLEVALRHAQRQQAFLKTTALLADILHNVEKGAGLKEQEALLAQARPLLEAMGRIVEEMKSAYDVKDDLAGLLWSGASHESLSAFAAKWKKYTVDMLSGIEWQEVAAWRTEEFPDANTIITKEVDVTKQLAAAGPVFVRWKWTGGQLGISIYESSLWEVKGGKRACISKDSHKGFTGARDTSPMYQLEIKRVEKGARYTVEGRIQANASHGTVAERGSFGKVILGVKP